LNNYIHLNANKNVEKENIPFKKIDIPQKTNNHFLIFIPDHDLMIGDIDPFLPGACAASIR